MIKLVNILQEIKIKSFKGLPQHDWEFEMSPDEKEEAIQNGGLYYTSGIFYNKSWASRPGIHDTTIHEITDFINNNFSNFDGEVAIAFTNNTNTNIEYIIDINPDIKPLIKIFPYGTQSFSYTGNIFKYYVKLILIPDE